MEIIPVVLIVLVLVGALLWQKHSVDKLREEFANDPDVEVAPGWMMKMQMRSHHHPGHIVQAGGGKNNPPRWDVTTSVPRLQGRTTLSLSREGFAGGLREMFGIKDVHIGDAVFDKAYTLRGSDADSVRGILSTPAVQQAVNDLFAHSVWSFDVKKDGTVVCKASRSRLSGENAKLILMSAVLLATTLNEHAEQPAVPAQVA